MYRAKIRRSKLPRSGVLCTQENGQAMGRREKSVQKPAQNLSVSLDAGAIGGTYVRGAGSLGSTLVSRRGSIGSWKSSSKSYGRTSYWCKYWKEKQRSPSFLSKLSLQHLELELELQPSLHLNPIHAQLTVLTSVVVRTAPRSSEGAEERDRRKSIDRPGASPVMGN